MGIDNIHPTHSFKWVLDIYYVQDIIPLSRISYLLRKVKVYQNNYTEQWNNQVNIEDNRFSKNFGKEKKSLVAGVTKEGGFYLKFEDFNRR